MKTLRFMIIALLCAVAQGAWAQTNVSTDQALRSAITNGANIQLTADIDLSNRTLEIASGTTVTIDLGGHTLDRKLTKRGESGGTVITVRSGATLNLSNGTLKGGWGGDGGGLVIEKNNSIVGTANLTNVTITGNVADDRGGGISNHGTLTMKGGAITDNISQDNTAPRGGGGIFNADGATATLTNVTISGNKTTEFPGGGICNHGGGTLTLDGCTITDNTAGSQGGGIWQEGTLNIQGANNITGNTNSTSLADNIYLPKGAVIAVTGSLEGSNIGISMEVPGTFTSGYSTKNSGIAPATIFKSDLPEAMGITLADNEAQLSSAIPEGSVYYIERSWDENSKKVVANTVILNEGEYTLLTARDYDDDLTLSGGTYVVKTTGSGKVYVDGFVKINGNTKLILCDGATMKVEKTIRVAPGRNFSVYGQMKNTGLLQNDADLSFAEQDYCGIGTYDGRGSTYSFHGGTIDVHSSGGNAAGIGLERSHSGEDGYHTIPTILIYGGNIKAIGGSNLNDPEEGEIDGSPGIGSYWDDPNGTIIIYGGDVDAEGGHGAGIGIAQQGNRSSSGNFSIVINGGHVIAKGGTNAAGIGGARDRRGGIMIINGGHVEAYGGDSGAGIGNGFVSEYFYNGYTELTVTDGYVYAQGGKNAAGIGGGQGSAGYTVTVSGGEVHAQGGDDAAGIGGGWGCDGGNVTITGGTVIARGAGNGAGIGSGSEDIHHENTNGGTLTITGGHVEAYGGVDAAGIGGGEDADGGTVKISGGYVYAQGNDWGAGIGGGQDGDGGDVTITGGTVIAKAGRNETGMRAIGPGEDSDNYGKLTIGDEMMVSSERKAGTAERKNMCWYRTQARVEICDHSSGFTYTVDGTTANDHHISHCQYCNHSDTELHTFENGTCTVCGVQATAYAAKLYMPKAQNDGSFDNETYGVTTTHLVVPNSAFRLPMATLHVPGLRFVGWEATTAPTEDTYTSPYTTTAENLYNVGSQYTVTGNICFVARYKVSDIDLYDNKSNGETLNEYNGKTVSKVILSGRTLVKNGQWNTLCLPFDATLTGDLDGATLMELDTDAGSYAHITGFDEATGTLYLNFKTAKSIVAGKPYIIKWTSGSSITDPTFSNVTINNTRTEVESADGTLVFAGAYSPLFIGKVNKNLLFLGAGNTLYYPDQAMTIGSCRAHFRLKGIEASPSSSQGGENPVRSFVLNFDDNANGIGLIENGKWKIENEAGAWYSLDGRKLSGKPTKKGVYINNGLKRVIK